jgi:hypothetical protein
MGIWGPGITSDDTVADVVDAVVGRMKRGEDLVAACRGAEREFAPYLQDEDDGPLVWLALAHVQWKYGAVEAHVLERVRADVSTGRGLERWRENPALLAQRQAALARFLEEIESPNPKPSRPPRPITRLAPFADGDCLSVLTSDGRFTAAIVLATNNADPENGYNLVGGLDYLSETPPPMAIFEDRAWLRMYHGNWDGQLDLCYYLSPRLKSNRKRFVVVGKTRLRSGDPSEAIEYSSWEMLGTQILLCRSDTPAQ